MDDLVYDLLLKSAQGLTLFGTLRFRFTDLDAVHASADVPALMKAALEQTYVELDVYQMAGEISVQFLTGPRALPLLGVSFASPPSPLPLTTILNGGDDTRQIGMQFNYFDATHIAGGLVWQYGTAREMRFSILGTQRALGL